MLKDISDQSYQPRRPSNQSEASGQQRGGYKGGRGGYPGTRGGFRGVKNGHVNNRVQFASNIPKVWECIFCSVDTHRTVDCRNLKKASNQFFANRRQDGPSYYSSQPNYNQQRGHSSSYVASEENNNSSPTSEETNKQEGHQDDAYAASHCYKDRDVFDWFTDSGATQHMTDQPQMIGDYEAIKPGIWSVSGIGGTNLPVLGKGSVTVIAEIDGREHDFVIGDVLHVDQLGINLFSIGAATEKGMRGSFVGNKCLFYYNNKLVLTGERAARTMYYLNIIIRSKLHDYAHTARPAEPLAKWHQRLGHADSNNIWRMFTENIVDGLEVLKGTHQEICSGCAKGKMHRLPFKSSTTPKADRIGGRIHSDVCGPMPYVSLGGARFFIIFKDEFSGYFIVNFLKHKSEAFGHLQAVYAFLKNQTGNTIKILRTDNGTEYVNNATSR